ncbi:hypothetical protein C8Q77DRAFT_1152846 [Trametes polyzona]|nr:hypothetical protein C8Q77DRAFT_1152846 [Trametes polyzona]
MLINAAFALTTVGQFLLVLLLATLFLSRSTCKRSPVLLNLLIICLLSTIPQFLLMYADQVYDPKPSFGLCATQAALLGGVRCTFAVVSLSLVIDLLIGSQGILAKASRPQYLRAALVIIPYITFLAFCIGVAAFGAAHPEQVRHAPNDLACTLHNPSFITVVQIFIAVIVVLTLGLETYAILRSVATRRHIPAHPAWHRRPPLLSFSQAARIVAFTCLQALLLILSTLRTYVHDDAVRIADILLQALMPISTFSIFGLTEDCCKAWKSLAQQANPRRWARHHDGSSWSPAAAFGGRSASPAKELVVTITVELTCECESDYDPSVDSHSDLESKPGGPAKDADADADSGCRRADAHARSPFRIHFPSPVFPF